MEDPSGVLACDQLQIKFLPKIEEDQIYTLTAVFFNFPALPSLLNNPESFCELWMLFFKGRDN